MAAGRTRPEDVARRARRTRRQVHTVCVAIVDGPKRVEALLARGVPDGEVQRGALDGDALREVRGLYCCGLRVREHVCDVAQQQGRLPHAACGQRGVRQAAPTTRGTTAPPAARRTLAQEHHLERLRLRRLPRHGRCGPQARRAATRRGSARKRVRAEGAAAAAGVTSGRPCRQRSKLAESCKPRRRGGGRRRALARPSLCRRFEGRCASRRALLPLCEPRAAAAPAVGAADGAGLRRCVAQDETAAHMRPAHRPMRRLTRRRRVRAPRRLPA